MKYISLLLSLILCFVACNGQEQGTNQETGSKKNYEFSNGVISREVLDNYLSRAITQENFLSSGRWAPYTDPEDDDTRMLLNIGAKFIGRSVHSWSTFEMFNDAEFWKNAKAKSAKVHARDPDVIFQAAIFEIVVMHSINTIDVPAYVFEAFNLPVQKRKFKYEDMLNLKGSGVNFWANGASIPDITRQETRMFFYYMACTYMDAGVEAIHFGQVMLISMDDRNNNFSAYREMLAKVREAAKTRARRGTILCDAHLPNIAVDGKLMFDFASYPMRFKEIIEEPQKAMLEKGYLDAMYGRTVGGITPSGWSCDRSPYLVEFDNNGISNHPNVPSVNVNDSYCWGFDETSWFAKQPQEYRNEFLEYIVNWIAEVDPIGHIEMNGSRVVTFTTGNTTYRANTKSQSCAAGYGQEKTIKKIWSK